ncbi:MAG: hypothetical protein H6742_15560 [Alphaproteobacteria bacterium]|nr:hypothetical protein [Alphaproteobacteria bacterium]
MSTPRPADLDTCVYCPKLCRHVCPVAVGSAREAAAPSNMALHPWRFLRGDGSVSLAREAAALCVHCDACTDHCDVHRPLGDLLAAVRHQLLPPAPAAAPGPIEGAGRRVAVEADDRRWAEALAEHLGEPVARLRTDDHLGAAHLAHPLADGTHAAALRALLQGRVAVVADHRSLSALRAVGITAEHLVDRVALADEPGTSHHPCLGPRLPGATVPGALACCGARERLQEVHPDTARQVAAHLGRTLSDEGEGPLKSPDSACACALRDAGFAVRDPVDALLHPLH